MNVIVRCAPDVSHEGGRLSADGFNAAQDRHFYAAAHQGWWAVFEQTGPNPDYWRVCVDGILYYTEALELAERLIAMRLPVRP